MENGKRKRKRKIKRKRRRGYRTSIAMVEQRITEQPKGRGKA
jgi:hypothetical protein